jgi:type II secretory pathway pseudopilin PulG
MCYISSMNFQRRIEAVEVRFQSALNRQRETQQEQQHYATSESHNRLHRRVAAGFNQGGTKNYCLFTCWSGVVASTVFDSPHFTQVTAGVGVGDPYLL